MGVYLENRMVHRLLGRVANVVAGAKRIDKCFNARDKIPHLASRTLIQRNDGKSPATMIIKSGAKSLLRIKRRFTRSARHDKHSEN
jgi:hypothetical protein